MPVTVNCPTCLPIDGAVPSVIGTYDLATATPRVAFSATAINCRNPDDLQRYSLQSGRRFSNIEYTFVLACPAGYSCAGGYYPRPVTIPADTIVFTVPDDIIDPDTETLTDPWYGTATCCDTTVTVNAPAGTTMEALTLLISQAATDCALAKANCEIFNSPSNGVPKPVPNTNRIQITLSSALACASVPYLARFVSSHSTGRVFWTLTGGGLPPGILLEDQTGFTVAQTAILGISGTCTTPGNYAFSLLSSDSLGNSITKNFTISVLGFTNSPPNGTVGGAYSFQFTVDGGMGPYSYSVLAAALPDGLIMNASGLITGTPANDTPCVPIFTVTDSLGQSCQKQFSLTPSSGTCATTIAALDWVAAPQAIHQVGASVSMTVFGQDFDGGVGGELWGNIANNTGAPFSIKITVTWSGTLTSHANAFLDAQFDGVSFGNSFPTGPDAWVNQLVAQDTYVIGVGETHQIYLLGAGGVFHAGSSLTYTATLVVECV